jgi:hypothetical protein
MSSTTDIDQKQMSKGVAYVAAAVSMPEIIRLENRVSFLEAIVESLTNQIVHLQAQLSEKVVFAIKEELHPPSSEIIDAVESYFKDKGEAYPSEIADKLGISVKEVVAAICILQKEKKVGEV